MFIEYITEEIAAKTRYKSLIDAWQRNNISIIKKGSIFYIEGHGCSNRVYEIAIKETKRLYPDLIYLYDVSRMRLKA